MSKQVFAFIGNDEIGIQNAVKGLKDRLDPASSQMNLTVLEGQVSIEALSDALQTMPFLDKHRLVLLPEPSKSFPPGARRNALLENLENLPDSTLVALYEAGNARKPEQHWLAKWARKQPHVEFKSFLLPRDMSTWIVQETRRQGGRISPLAARRLAELVGEQPRYAAQEITKLLTYVNADRPIQQEDVEAVCVSVSEASIFDFVDALGQGKAQQAQKVFHHLLRDQDPFQIFGMIVRQFRLLLQTRELLDAHLASSEIEAALGQHPYVVKKLIAQAGNFQLSTLEAIYHHLQAIDSQVKRHQIDLDLAIDLFIARFAA